MNETKEHADIKQYLTFKIGDEMYAVDVLKVREVLEWTKITKLPKTPPFLSGVINLRGNVVPIIDLRLKFDMPQAEKTVDTSFVILEVADENDIVIVGGLVDAVREVIKLNSNQLEPPPKMGLSVTSEFITALGKREDDFVIILNVDRVFSKGEISAIKNAQESMSEGILSANGVE